MKNRNVSRRNLALMLLLACGMGFSCAELVGMSRKSIVNKAVPDDDSMKKPGDYLRKDISDQDYQDLGTAAESKIGSLNPKQIPQSDSAETSKASFTARVKSLFKKDTTSTEKLPEPAKTSSSSSFLDRSKAYLKDTFQGSTKDLGDGKTVEKGLIYKTTYTTGPDGAKTQTNKEVRHRAKVIGAGVTGAAIGSSASLLSGPAAALGMHLYDKKKTGKEVATDNQQAPARPTQSLPEPQIQTTRIEAGTLGERRLDLRDASLSGDLGERRLDPTTLRLGEDDLGERRLDQRNVGLDDAELGEAGFNQNEARIRAGTLGEGRIPEESADSALFNKGSLTELQKNERDRDYPRGIDYSTVGQQARESKQSVFGEAISQPAVPSRTPLNVTQTGNIQTKSGSSPVVSTAPGQAPNLLPAAKEVSQQVLGLRQRPAAKQTVAPRDEAPLTQPQSIFEGAAKSDQRGGSLTPYREELPAPVFGTD